MYVALFTPQFLRLQMKGFYGRNHLSNGNITGIGFTMSDAPATILLCMEDNDMMEITSVVLMPDPPKKGENLTVAINGYLKEPLEESAYLVAKVKKGGIKFPQFHVSICDYLSGGCPVAKGLQKLSMTFDIPSLIPGGGYEIDTEIFQPLSEENVVKNSHLLTKFTKFTKDFSMKDEDKRVLCLQGSIEF